MEPLKFNIDEGVNLSMTPEAIKALTPEQTDKYIIALNDLFLKIQNELSAKQLGII
jgi:hypothetical protein